MRLASIGFQAGKNEQSIFFVFKLKALTKGGGVVYGKTHGFSVCFLRKLWKLGNRSRLDVVRKQALRQRVSFSTPPRTRRS